MTFDEVLSTARSMLTDEELNSMLREKYPGPNGARRLAENLVSIFGAEHPGGQTIRGPVTIVQADPNAPALTVIGDPNSTISSVNNIGGGGGTTITPSEVTYPDQPPPATGSVASGFAMILYGYVQTKVSGQVYSVLCYQKGPDVGPAMGLYRVLQDNISTEDTIPPGTPVLVWVPINSGKQAGTMRMLVPTWLPNQT